MRRTEETRAYLWSADKTWNIFGSCRQFMFSFLLWKSKQWKVDWICNYRALKTFSWAQAYMLRAVDSDHLYRQSWKNKRSSLKPSTVQWIRQQVVARWAVVHSWTVLIFVILSIGCRELRAVFRAREDKVTWTEKNKNKKNIRFLLCFAEL